MWRTATEADWKGDTKDKRSWEKRDGGLWTSVCTSLWGKVTPVAQSLSPQSKREGHCNLSLYQTRAIFSQSYLKKTVRIHTSRSDLRKIDYVSSHDIMHSLLHLNMRLTGAEASKYIEKVKCEVKFSLNVYIFKYSHIGWLLLTHRRTIKKYRKRNLENPEQVGPSSF